MTAHYHLETPNDSMRDDPYRRYDSLVAIADALAYEAADLSECLRQSAETFGEYGDYENAWQTLKESDRLDVLAINAGRFDGYTRNPATAAPLFRNVDGSLDTDAMEKSIRWTLGLDPGREHPTRGHIYQSIDPFGIVECGIVTDDIDNACHPDCYSTE